MFCAPREAWTLSEKRGSNRCSTHLAKTIISRVKSRECPFDSRELRLCLSKHLAPTLKHRTIAGEVFGRFTVKILPIYLEYLRRGRAFVERSRVVEVLRG